MPHPLRTFAVMAILCATTAIPSTAIAGPGQFDPQRGEFKLTYTYADLPNLYSAAGTPRPLDPVADQKIRAFIQEVSRLIFVVTDGRAKIGSFEPVESVARADVIISLVGDPGRAAWANLGALGKQGNVAFYYQYLEPKPREGVALTAAHEFCHYLFGLPDEYEAPGFQQNPNCPPAPGTPRVPGCLMDNYWSQGGRGWYHRLCDETDHNKNLISQGTRYGPGMSCKSLINRFFEQFPSATRPTEDSGTGAATGATQPAAAVNQPMLQRAKLTIVIQEAINRVRAASALRSPAITSEKLRTLANEVIRAGIQSLGVSISEAEIGTAARRVIDAAAMVGLTVPTRIKDKAGLIDLLRARARALVTAYATLDRGQRVQTVSQELRKAALQGLAPPQGGLNLEELGFLRQLATETVSEVAGEVARPSERPTSAEGVRYQLDRLVAQIVLGLAAKQNLALTDSAFDTLRDLDVVASEFALPRRTIPRFGARRTVLIAPPPLDPANNNVLVQSGIEPFTALRDRYILQFSKLINRTQIDLQASTLVAGGDDTERVVPRNLVGFTPEGETIDRRRGSTTPRGLLDDLLVQIRRNEIENIAVLVPPGGLGNDIDDLLIEYKNQLRGKTDLRLDIVAVGTADVPPLLRDLSYRSGGVSLTISDSNEVGAIAQRLRNEQAAGAWIVLPRVFDFPSGAQDGTAGQTPPPGQGVPSVPKTPAEVALETVRPELLQLGSVDRNRVKGRLMEAILPLRAEVRQFADSLQGPRYTAVMLESLLSKLTALDTDIVVLDRDLHRLGGAMTARDEDLPKVLMDLGLEKEEIGPNDVDRKKALAGKILEYTIRVKATHKRLDNDQKALRSALEAVGAKRPTMDKYRPTYDALARIVRLIERATPTKLVGEYQPVFTRTNPVEYVKAIRGLDIIDANIDRVPFFAGPDPHEIPFYAEKNSEFEIVIGLSHIPPFDDPSLATLEAEARFLKSLESPELVAMTLLDRDGRPLGLESLFQMDTERSTSTMRVYRLRDDPSRPEGWYRLKLVENAKYARMLQGDTMRYTVSISSLRPNVQLNVGLAYEPGDPAPRGTFEARRVGEDKKDPIVEVQVFGGTAITGATVQGFYQVLGTSNKLEKFPHVTFVDDGGGKDGSGDRVRNDGVYSARLPILVDDVPDGGAVYRVAIQAYTTGGRRDERGREIQAENIAPEPSDSASHEAEKAAAKDQSQDRTAQGGREARDKAVEKVGDRFIKPLIFQRATSFQFRVNKPTGP
jgi:hypothetical protein